MPSELDLRIETERLELGPIGRDDAEGMLPVLSDAALYAHTGGRPPESEAALRKLFASRETRQSPDGTELWFNWVVRLRSPDQGPLGYVQASVSTTGADVAWVIGSRWQNRGYASEAATAVVGWLLDLGMKRVHASIHPEHGASQKVAARAGLRRTDTTIDGEEVWLLEVD
jgi:RimJ/RimL family protein N-acetyltransferase